MPFSVQMPERVRQLQAHQALYTSKEAWWLCDRRQPPPVADMSDANKFGGRPRFTTLSPVSDIQGELQAAISTTFIPCSSGPSDSSTVKTSSSHPIK